MIHELSEARISCVYGCILRPHILWGLSNIIVHLYQYKENMLTFTSMQEHRRCPNFSTFLDKLRSTRKSSWCCLHELLGVDSQWHPEDQESQFPIAKVLGIWNSHLDHTNMVKLQNLHVPRIIKSLRTWNSTNWETRVVAQMPCFGHQDWCTRYVGVIRFGFPCSPSSID